VSSFGPLRVGRFFLFLAILNLLSRLIPRFLLDLPSGVNDFKRVPFLLRVPLHDLLVLEECLPVIRHHADLHVLHHGPLVVLPRVLFRLVVLHELALLLEVSRSRLLPLPVEETLFELPDGLVPLFLVHLPVPPDQVDLVPRLLTELDLRPAQTLERLLLQLLLPLHLRLAPLYLDLLQSSPLLLAALFGLGADLVGLLLLSSLLLLLLEHFGHFGLAVGVLRNRDLVFQERLFRLEIGKNLSKVVQSLLIFVNLSMKQRVDFSLTENVFD